MKIISWNVNGVRAVAKNGLTQFLRKSQADVIGLQETKAQKEQLDADILKPLNYSSVWFSAEDKGYSGVSFYYKKEPLNVVYGIGNKEIDCEGRVIGLEYKDYYIFSAYFPNSGRDHKRLGYKLDFCKNILKFLKEIEKKKPFIICGDFNIAHQDIDLANPKSNKNNAGFLPEERAWMSDFLEQGYIDVFRAFNSSPGHYTWWSYRPGVREKNIGWRIDYFCSSPELKSRLKGMEHLVSVKGSDHCPIALEVK